jgi:hypothetical protein
MKVSELKEHILKHMTADEALEKLLQSSVMRYEKLKFDKGEEVHPLLIITFAALDLGWQLAIERDNEEVRGLAVGSEEYLNNLFKSEK